MNREQSFFYLFPFIRTYHVHHSVASFTALVLKWILFSHVITIISNYLILIHDNINLKWYLQVMIIYYLLYHRHSYKCHFNHDNDIIYSELFTHHHGNNINFILAFTDNRILSLLFPLEFWKQFCLRFW